MWELDVKKAEHRRTDGFKFVCWRKLLRVPWGARKSNYSILKVITLNVHWKDWYWTEAPTLYPPDAKSWLTGKAPHADAFPDVGKDWRQGEKCAAEDEMLRQNHGLNSTWIWAKSRRYWRTEEPGMLQSIGSQKMRHDLLDWTITTTMIYNNLSCVSKSCIWINNFLATKVWLYSFYQNQLFQFYLKWSIFSIIDTIHMFIFRVINHRCFKVLSWYL